MNGEYGHCPHCGSDKLHRNGMTYTRQGPVQRYYCRSCHRNTAHPKLQLELLREPTSTPGLQT